MTKKSSAYASQRTFGSCRAYEFTTNLVPNFETDKNDIGSHSTKRILLPEYL